MLEFQGLRIKIKYALQYLFNRFLLNLQKNSKNFSGKYFWLLSLFSMESRVIYQGITV